MGRRSYPCTRHRWWGYAYRHHRCTRCGAEYREPIPPTERRQARAETADVLAAARALAHALREAAEPPRARVPRDPSRRTPGWEYRADMWEAVRDGELRSAVTDARRTLVTYCRWPYRRRDRRRARRLLALVPSEVARAEYARIADEVERAINGLGRNDESRGHDAGFPA